MSKKISERGISAKSRNKFTDHSIYKAVQKPNAENKIVCVCGSHIFPYAVDLSKGRRFELLYTDLIGPSIEHEDNFDSRVLKTFLIQTLNGINNYAFSKNDKRLMLPQEKVSQMTFWLRFNTGELIPPGYPIT